MIKIKSVPSVKVYICALLLLAATVFVFSNSLKGPIESGKESGRVTEIVIDAIESVKGEVNEDEKEDIHHFVRKFAHFAEFALLALFSMLLIISVKSPRFVHLLPYALLYGILVAVFDEYIQSFTGRGSAVKDVLLDFSGFLFGCVFTCCLVYLVMRIKNRSATA